MKRWLIAVGAACGAVAVVSGAESHVFASSCETASNLVFGAGATLDVAAGATVTALGPLSLGDNASGDITKTGGGTFELATALPIGAVNGDGANGGTAVLRRWEP